MGRPVTVQSVKVGDKVVFTPFGIEKYSAEIISYFEFSTKFTSRVNIREWYKYIQYSVLEAVGSRSLYSTKCIARIRLISYKGYNLGTFIIMINDDTPYVEYYESSK